MPPTRRIKEQRHGGVGAAADRGSIFGELGGIVQGLGGLGGYLGPPWGWIIKHGKHIPFGEHCWSMRLSILLIKPMENHTFGLQRES